MVRFYADVLRVITEPLESPTSKLTSRASRQCPVIWIRYLRKYPLGKRHGKGQSKKGDSQMSETEKTLEVTIEATMEELEDKVAPEATSKDRSQSQ